MSVAEEVLEEEKEESSEGEDIEEFITPVRLNGPSLFW